MSNNPRNSKTDADGAAKETEPRSEYAEPRDNILCPYCFGNNRNQTFTHEQACFRSPIVYDDEMQVDSLVLPKEYKSRTLFEAGYDKPDAGIYRAGLEKLSRLIRREDDKLTRWWAERGGADVFFGKNEGGLKGGNINIYEIIRRYGAVIDPSDEKDRIYLDRDPQGRHYTYDSDGFVDGLNITDGYRSEIARIRVCPFCHNELPAHYGKFPVKFISVIGVTGAGKSVYLSRLFQNLTEYCANIGMGSVPTSAQMLRKFLVENKVTKKCPLPQPTPKGVVNPPLFYDIGAGKKQITLVFYDIAGENCVPNEPVLPRYQPFINRSDGIILLLDPKQFPAFNDKFSEDAAENKVNHTYDVMTTIHNTLAGASTAKIDTPFAACISKADQPEIAVAVNDVLESLASEAHETRAELKLSEVLPLTDPNKYPAKKFNAREYNKIGEALYYFIHSREKSLFQSVSDHFNNFNFFWLSATGCAVRKQKGDNGEDEYVLDLAEDEKLPPARRIEEPLYWMLHRWKMLPSDVPVFDPSEVGNADIAEKEKGKGKLGIFGFLKKKPAFDKKQ